jgi:Tfp pilus assembly protein FimV
MTYQEPTMTRIDTPLRPFGRATALICLLAAVHAQGAQPAPPPSPAAASKAHSAPAPAAPALPPGSYKPKPGESLDAVITKTLGDSPLKLAVLRAAFIQQNPAAFVEGKAPLLRKGAVLMVPDHNSLLLSLMPPVPIPVAAMESQAAPSPDEDRKRWVKYP